MYVISFSSGQSSFLCGDNESLLEAAIRNGKSRIKAGCFGGGCGICRINIQSGEWMATGPMSVARVSRDEQERGVVLACKVKPLANLLIDLEK